MLHSLTRLSAFCAVVAVFLALTSQHGVSGSTVQLVGGAPVGKDKFPYMVSINKVAPGDMFSSHFCGGTLIDEWHVLTAAHCKVPTSARVVVHGHGHKHGENVKQNGILVKKVYSHNFTASTTKFENDLAILRLSAAVSPALTDYVDLATDTDIDDPLPNDKVTILGYGRTKENGPMATGLEQISLPVITEATCKAGKGDPAFLSVNYALQLCAYDTTHHVDACESDSGGPVFFEDTQVGVVSWGTGCAKADAPGVYVRVSGYKSWIVSTLAQSKADKIEEDEQAKWQNMSREEKRKAKREMKKKAKEEKQKSKSK